MGRTYTLSVANSRFETELKAREYTFATLYERLKQYTPGNETIAEYLRLPKPIKDERKDKGGFVAGKLLGGRRKTGCVQSREIITLDIDNIPCGGAEPVLNKLRTGNVAWLVYSTRKHTPEAPRLRVLIPLSRPCSADEYEPAARKVASMLDPTMAMFDKTTFQAHRLMFWPSVSQGGEYICEGQEKPEIDVDYLLSSQCYTDWKNVQEWPRCPGENEQVHRDAAKQENPTLKKNVVGAFCRVYDVHTAIDEFLSDVYESSDGERYTFLGGSTAKGAIVYGDGTFIYSHHGTDPASGQLLNAFDLVRLHKFGGLDTGESKTVTKLPSYKAMQSFCMQIPAVLEELDEQRKIDTSAVFGGTQNPFGGKQNGLVHSNNNIGYRCGSGSHTGGTITELVNPFAPKEVQSVTGSDIPNPFREASTPLVMPRPVADYTVQKEEVVNPFAPKNRELVNPFATGNIGPVNAEPSTIPIGDSSACVNPFGVAGSEHSEAPEEINPSWKQSLTRNLNTGAIEISINNFVAILMNDPVLKGNIKFNEFSHYGVEAQPGLPWNKSKKPRAWTDTDDSYMRMYMEANYGGYHKDKVFDAINIVADTHTYDPVRDFIKAEKWDGKPRLETAIIDYLGAEDNTYTRTVTRKSLVAAVARVMEPGIKFDIMTIIGGPQGLGKSTFLRSLSNGWFLDGLDSFDGKDTPNKMRATWIIEMGEIVGLTKTETDRVKQFLSQNEDIMRLPYGRRVGIYPRRCIFFGTTNNYDYLKDQTGSRRFWPVDAGMQEPTKDVFTDLIKEVPQLWAEAYYYYLKGENIMVMDEQIAKLAAVVQESHTEVSPKAGIIQEFVAKKVPENWSTLGVEERKIYWASPELQKAKNLVDRKKVCAAEIWVECFGKDFSQMRPTDTREINAILCKIPEFQSKNGAKPMRFGKFYGSQRGFTRNDGM